MMIKERKLIQNLNDWGILSQLQLDRYGNTQILSNIEDEIKEAWKENQFTLSIETQTSQGEAKEINETSEEIIIFENRYYIPPKHVMRQRKLDEAKPYLCKCDRGDDQGKNL